MIFKWEIRLWIFFLNPLFFSNFPIFFKKRISGIWIYTQKTFYFNFRNIFPTFYTWQEIWYKKNLLCDEGFFVWISYFRGLICLSNHDCFQVIFIGKFLNIFSIQIYLSHARCVFEASVFFYIPINYWSGH